MKNRTVYWQASVAFAINFFAGFGFFIAFLVQYFDKEIVIYDLLFYALILWAISAAFLVVTSYSWPGFSQDTKATPVYQPISSKAPSAAEDSSEDESPNKFWVCDCGVKNRAVASACCGCGEVRSHKAGSDGYKKCSCGAMVLPGLCPLCGANVR